MQLHHPFPRTLAFVYFLSNMSEYSKRLIEFNRHRAKACSKSGYRRERVLYFVKREGKKERLIDYAGLKRALFSVERKNGGKRL